jgi:O-antigen/teichoic acid export membrane protein
VTGFGLVKHLLPSQNPLLERAARGAGWLFAMQMGKKLLTVGQTLILARLLQPKDFGSFGIILASVSFIETLNQVAGFQTALVQKRRELSIQLDTAWTVLVGQGCFNALLLMALSGPISRFFGAPEAAPLMRVYSMTLLLNGFVNIGVIYFQKELDFFRQLVFVLLETFVGVVITVSVALLTRSVWALVVGGLGGVTVRLISSFVMQKYRPTLRLHWPSLRELLTFGQWIWLSSMIFFFQSQGDNIVVGKVLGVTALGFYRVVYSIANLGGTEIGNILGRIMLPVYSRLQEDLGNLRDTYVKFTRVQTLIILPVAVCIVTLAPEFVRVSLGEDWVPAAPVLQVLTGFSLFNAMVRRAEVLLEGTGFPKHGTIGRGLFLVFAGASIYPMAVWLQLPGVALAVLGGVFMEWLYVEYQAARILSFTGWELVKASAPNLVAAGGMAFLIAALKLLISTSSSLLLLTLLAPIGLVVYLLVVIFTTNGDVLGFRKLAN